jgi:hypothetical protein
METDTFFKMMCFFKKLDDGQSPQKRWFQLISVKISSFFWISLPLKMGPTGCPAMSARNYHSTLCNILEEGRPNMIWQCRPLFESEWSG